ncbi:uncharacterized protein LOC120351003 isoform X2 [Nilaparvata lugens]|uniref:uncharacterized protein LOC120351003 isoform X2 n=1 Tax=Nilaparvata lugens TaxID=108931 RepID=UPI00193D587E|nr:uncharacterized protein LOC120351003 isoform X2 [Nilaparvata lugens]
MTALTLTFRDDTSRSRVQQLLSSRCVYKGYKNMRLRLCVRACSDWSPLKTQHITAGRLGGWLSCVLHGWHPGLHLISRRHSTPLHDKLFMDTSHLNSNYIFM